MDNVTEPSVRQYDVRAIANWILDRAQTIEAPTPTNMAINKIVYFLFERMLVEEKRKIFSAKVEAWEHGPVVRELYSEFKKHGDAPISSRARRFSIVSRQLEVAHDEIDKHDCENFRLVVDYYLPMSAATLRRISHQADGPWFMVWSHEGASNPGMEITPEVIADSFLGYRTIS